MKILAIGLLLGAALAVPARAEVAGGQSLRQESAPAPKYFDFEDDQVEGDIKRPDGDLVTATTRAKHRSLIEIRRNFIPEMIKSLEDLD